MGLINWLFGYLILEVTGKNTERFVNLCAHFGILIKNAVKKEDALEIRVSRKAFIKMLKPKKRSGCRVKIIEKRGLPFLIKRWNKRKILLIGAFVFMVITGALNSFIWTIRIDGNEKITDEEIKIIANYCGLRQGVLKYKVDEKKFSENALKCEGRLSWIWPEIKGSVLYIHVREKATEEKPIDLKEPMDVIAKRSGRINSITVKRGFPLVSEGELVTKGQVLISSHKEGFTPVHAMGEIYASYWSEIEDKATTLKKVVTYTGREKSYYSLKIGSFGMSFRFSGKAPFETFEKETKEKGLKLFSEIPLPVFYGKTTYKETKVDLIKIPMEEAVSEKALLMEEEFLKNLEKNVEIKDKILKTETLSEDETRIALVFECEEDIALGRKE